MSDLIREMQEKIDEHKEALGDGAYVSLSNGLKELHAATNLYEVRYITFEAHCGDPENVATMGVIFKKRVRIMAKKEYVGGIKKPCWNTAFRFNELPNDMSNCVLNRPTHDDLTCYAFIVTSVKPYLKRSREEADDDSE